MKKSAFTMLELVFVIVVIGILAAVFIPRFERDDIGEAAYQIARHIRLAQHYALVEDRFNDAPAGVDWRETLWRITFVTSGNKNCYRVFADRNGGGSANNDEVAVDPLTKKRLNVGSTCSEGATVPDDILLWKSYGVSSVDLGNGCDTGYKNIAFDHLGRPGQVYNGTMNYLPSDCEIAILTKNGHNATITVTRDTGFVKVTRIDGTPLP